MTTVEQTRPEEAASEGTREPVPASGDSARPIAVVMDFVGATLSQVDQLLKAMQLATGDAGSPGSLFLWSRSTLDGVRITEVQPGGLVPEADDECPLGNNALG
jgi:hypothetical protein